MAVIFGKGSQISIGGSAVGQITGWDYDESDTQTDITNYDSTRREFANIGLLDSNLNAEVQWDLADTGQDAVASALGGAAVAVIIYPEGNTSGKPTLTGTVLIGNKSVSSGGVDAAITASFSGKLSALTEGTVA